MLIVVKNRNPHSAPQLLLNLEAFGSFNILQVDSAESGFEELACPDNLLRVLAPQFNIEHVDIGKALEQDSFAFHDRFAGGRAEVA
jgi:hypothetical protein